MYHEAKLEPVLEKKKFRYKIDIAAPKELESHNEISLMLLNFHQFFDGILSLRDLKKYSLFKT